MVRTATRGVGRPPRRPWQAAGASARTTARASAITTVTLEGRAPTDGVMRPPLWVVRALPRRRRGADESTHALHGRLHHRVGIAPERDHPTGPAPRGLAV